MSFSIPAEFKNLGHYIASGAKKFVSFVGVSDTVIKKVEADAPTAEALASLLGPQAEAITTAGFACLGIFGQIMDDAANAVGHDLLNKSADASVISDIKSAVTFLKQPPVTAAK